MAVRQSRQVIPDGAIVRDIRRGVVDVNGMGDAAAGIVVVRFGESVYEVLRRVKRVIAEQIQPALPQGVELVVTYDRSLKVDPYSFLPTWLHPR